MTTPTLRERIEKAIALIPHHYQQMDCSCSLCTDNQFVLESLKDCLIELERNKLILKCARLLLKKLSLNDYGTDKECKRAYRELNAAFEELEKYEKEDTRV